MLNLELAWLAWFEVLVVEDTDVAVGSLSVWAGLVLLVGFGLGSVLVELLLLDLADRSLVRISLMGDLYSDWS